MLKWARIKIAINLLLDRNTHECLSNHTNFRLCMFRVALLTVAVRVCVESVCLHALSAWLQILCVCVM